MKRISGRHWALALSGAIVVHGAVAVVLLFHPPESGSVGVGMGGIEVSLGPAGGTPGDRPQTTETAKDPETKATTETTAAARPVEDSASEPPEMPPSDEAQPSEVETVEPRQEFAETPPEEVIEEVAAIEFPSQTSASDPSVAAESTPPAEEVDIQSGPSEVPMPRQKESATQLAAVQTPPPPKRRPAAPPKSEPTQLASASDTQARSKAATRAPSANLAKDEQMAAVSSSVRGASGKSGTDTNPEAGTADATPGGGVPGATADYMATLQAWLERHKEYPRRARLRRQEGIALLYFVMDRDGQVIEHRLQQSSGYDLLDREVAELIKRAQPLPKIPADMHQARLELVVPVQFSLR